MPESSRISITGKSFLIAVAMSLIATFLLTLLISFASLFFKLNAKENIVPATTAISDLISNFYLTFSGIAKCTVPMMTIFAFALLQRFRVKEL